MRLMMRKINTSISHTSSFINSKVHPTHPKHPTQLTINFVMQFFLLNHKIISLNAVFNQLKIQTIQL